MTNLTTVVLGDPMLDQWDRYKTARPTGPEGVPILVAELGEASLGGALNLAANYAAVARERITYFGQLGAPFKGLAIDLAEAAGVGVRALTHGRYADVTIKRRVTVDGKLLHRIDHDQPFTGRTSPDLVRSWLEAVNPSTLILCDYGKGALWPPSLAIAAADWFRTSDSKLLLVDAKPPLLSYFFGTAGSAIRQDPRVIFRCNYSEGQQIAQWPISSSRSSFVVTKGKAGALVMSSGITKWPVITLPTGSDARSIVGAGDAFTAALAYFVGVEELPVHKAAERACNAANAACMHCLQTVRLTPDDINEPVPFNIPDEDYWSND